MQATAELTAEVGALKAANPRGVFGQPDRRPHVYDSVLSGWASIPYERLPIIGA
jgi:hypothetical protein